MPATPVNPDLIALGAGWLYINTQATPVEPTTIAGAWDANWIKLGYTSEGHTFTWDMTTEGIYVAEEKLPVLNEVTKLQPMIQFNAAEITATNLQRALGGGTITTTANEATFTPPSFDTAPAVVALAWESHAADERIIWRKCQTAKPVEIKRQKAPNYATLPMAFSIRKPAGTTAPFVHIFAIARH